MLSNYVMPGDRVELTNLRSTGKTGEEEQDKKVYKSQINDILSEDCLEITMPMDKTKLQLLPVDAEYMMYIFTANGVYRCKVRVSQRYKSGNLYLLSMDLTSNLSKHQRREYYRYECALELEVRTLSTLETEALQKNEPFFAEELPLNKGIIVDISGGGIRFVSGTVFEPDSVLYLRFKLLHLDGPKDYRLAGRLLTVKKMENKPGLFENRVQFMNMEQKEREEIIKFIFEQERKQRKREKG